MFKLNDLFDIPGARKKKKRVGRGIGSGLGKTCGRGHKGQKSRSGVSIKTEGGQMPIIKRLPKRGFNPLNKEFYQLIDIADIELMLQNGIIDVTSEINKELLFKHSLISNLNAPVKILNSETPLQYKVNLNVDAYSVSVIEKIKAAGGEVSL